MYWFFIEKSRRCRIVPAQFICGGYIMSVHPRTSRQYNKVVLTAPFFPWAHLTYRSMLWSTASGSRNSWRPAPLFWLATSDPACWPRPPQWRCYRCCRPTRPASPPILAPIAPSENCTLSLLESPSQNEIKRVRTRHNEIWLITQKNHNRKLNGNGWNREFWGINQLTSENHKNN